MLFIYMVDINRLFVSIMFCHKYHENWSFFCRNNFVMYLCNTNTACVCVCRFFFLQMDFMCGQNTQKLQHTTVHHTQSENTCQIYILSIYMQFVTCNVYYSCSNNVNIYDASRKYRVYNTYIHTRCIREYDGID